MTIVPINAPDGAPFNISFVELGDAHNASDCTKVADSYNPDEPDPEHLHQIKQIWECKSGLLCRTDKVTCTFRLKQIPICAAGHFGKKLKSK